MSHTSGSPCRLRAQITVTDVQTDVFGAWTVSSSVPLSDSYSGYSDKDAIRTTHSVWQRRDIPIIGTSGLLWTNWNDNLHICPEKLSTNVWFLETNLIRRLIRNVALAQRTFRVFNLHIQKCCSTSIDVLILLYIDQKGQNVNFLPLLQPKLFSFLTLRAGCYQQLLFEQIAKVRSQRLLSHIKVTHW